MAYTSKFDKFSFDIVLGDAMIYDTSYDPWRLIKVVINENSGDDPVIDVSWTLDCQRLITITHTVRNM